MKVLMLMLAMTVMGGCSVDEAPDPQLPKCADICAPHTEIREDIEGTIIWSCPVEGKSTPMECSP